MRRTLMVWLAVSLAVVGCGKVGQLSYDAKSAPEGPPMARSAAEYAVGSDREQAEQPNREAYDRIDENAFLLVRDNPLSTFSIDVDTASYANARRFLQQGSLPPKDAVRIEEFINYFPYSYAPPADDRPFAAHVEIAPCPWKSNHMLALIGLKGRVVEQSERAPANLVFLLDVSGSMNAPNKLPLLKSAMRMLVQNLNQGDYVSIVVYAGASGVALPPTSCDNREMILSALDQLSAGGSTAGSAGIQLAYDVAQQHFSAEGTNRVILCTDGDFNVGITNQGDLTRLIEAQAKTGVFLSVLGFGMGNLQDSTLEKLADRGNGNYGYIDTALEARKVLVEQMGGTLITIAKDVKIQVDFNPTQVAAYRLIGYENRLLRNEDFADDTKDAGEIGAGHTVTALYELVPPGQEGEIPQTQPSKYQQAGQPSPAAMSDELLTVRLRYKPPTGDASTEISFPVKESLGDLAAATDDFRFTAAVAEFGLLLRDSQHKGGATYEQVLELARGGKGEDPQGYRNEFLQLVGAAQSLPDRSE